VLYICIPTHDEAPTVGVLLWRIRKVFQEYAREYEILVYDDASTDDTRAVLEPYAKALPLTVLGTRSRVGYGAAVAALLAEAAQRTKYPRRDAVILMQADFTDQPEAIPELVKRFEGGADLVVAERTLPADAPEGVQRLHRYVSWIPRVWPLRRAVTVPGVRDPWGTMRLIRIATVRDLLRGAVAATGTSALPWQANLELLCAAAPHARRLETISVTPRFDVRPRASRRDAWPDAWALAKAAWAQRSRRVALPAPAAAAPRTSQPSAS
jgi:glycosyltransferase involved in cell wall biosynthesis